MSIKKHITNILKNPNLYVAAVVGTIPGGGVGGAVGALSGGVIGTRFELCSGYTDPLLGVDLNIIAGIVTGLIIGAILGGILTGSFSIYKIHKKTYQLPQLSSEDVIDIFLGAFGISIEISIGMAIGAIIGSLKLLGIGTVLGAIMGIVLMLFSIALEKKSVRL